MTENPAGSGDIAHERDSSEAPAAPDENINAEPAIAAAVEDSSEAYVIGVMTNAGGKISNYFWNNLDLKVGDTCIVEDDNGSCFGKVAIARIPVEAAGCPKKRPKAKIIRRATKEDEEKAEYLGRKEKAAMSYCREKIVELDIPMSLSRVYYNFEGNKAVFFFTADGRVDFRELVKEMANFTRVKVEMRQIGVRDEARMMGGCGPCGGELCCSTFLSDFAPVSIRMAKDQNLSLNPAKISGVCGRLMCCLAYEHGHYKELTKMAPKMGKSCMTPDGRLGKVFQLNLLKEQVTVMFDDESKADYSLDEVSPHRGGPRPPRQEAGGGGEARKGEAVKPAPAPARDKAAEDRKSEQAGRPVGEDERKEKAEREAKDFKPVRKRRKRKRKPSPGQPEGVEAQAADESGREGAEDEKVTRSSSRTRKRRRGSRKRRRGPSPDNAS